MPDHTITVEITVSAPWRSSARDYVGHLLDHDRRFHESSDGIELTDWSFATHEHAPPHTDLPALIAEHAAPPQAHSTSHVGTESQHPRCANCQRDIAREVAPYAKWRTPDGREGVVCSHACGLSLNVSAASDVGGVPVESSADRATTRSRSHFSPRFAQARRFA